MTNKMKILAVLPAFNEGKNISQTVLDIRQNFPAADVLVINDCSLDETSEVSKITGAKVIDLPVNLGIGGAVQTGLIYARENNYDIAFQFDGDGQHRGDEIELILKPILDKTADTVIGSRFLRNDNGFKSSPIRRVGIRIISLINSLIIKQKVTDCTSGFRAYNRKTIAFLADNYPIDFPEPEAVILLGKNNFKIVEVPVMMKARANGNSSISGLKSIYYMIKVLVAVFMSALRN